MKTLMRCSSTGKLMRDSASGKLMTFSRYGVDCAYCDTGKTPRQIDVIVAGLVGCGCYHIDDEYSYYREYVAGATSVNDTYRLKQGAYDPVTHECVTGYDWCSWCHIEEGSFGQLKTWSGPGCTGTVTDTVVLERALCQVYFMANQIEVCVTLYNVSFSNSCVVLSCSLHYQWSSTQSYTVGTYLITTDVLYKCHTEHTNQQPPNSNYWVVVKNYHRECLPMEIVLEDLLRKTCKTDGTTVMAKGVALIAFPDIPGVEYLIGISIAGGTVTGALTIV